MVGYGLPTATQLAGLDTIEKIYTWCRCDQAIWQAMDTALGGVADLTLLILLPVSVLKTTFRVVRVGTPQRELHTMETIYIAYIWRVPRQTLQMADKDPLADPIPVATPAQNMAGIGHGKRIKVSSVIDQMDDLKINLMSRQELD